MENGLLEVNTNFAEMDREHFYSLFMNIRKMYNLFRKYDTDDNAKITSYEYILDNLTDSMFFQEQLRYRNLNMVDCYIKY